MPSLNVDDGDDEGDNDGDGDGDNDGAAADNQPAQDQWKMPQDSEQQCVCQNQSFDVPQVAALCSSCIAMANNEQNGTSQFLGTARLAFTVRIFVRAS